MPARTLMCRFATSVALYIENSTAKDSNVSYSTHNMVVPYLVNLLIPFLRYIMGQCSVYKYINQIYNLYRSSKPISWAIYLYWLIQNLGEFYMINNKLLMDI